MKYALNETEKIAIRELLFLLNKQKEKIIRHEISLLMSNLGFDNETVDEVVKITAKGEPGCESDALHLLNKKMDERCVKRGNEIREKTLGGSDGSEFYGQLTEKSIRLIATVAGEIQKNAYNAKLNFDSGYLKRMSDELDKELLHYCPEEEAEAAIKYMASIQAPF